MKKSVLVIISIVLVVIMTACSLPTFGGSNQGEPEKIKIGVVCPLTGESSLYGDVLHQTLTIMAENANAAGGIIGKQVELVIYDNRDDAVETTNAARRAALDDKVIAFIGTDSSTTTLAMIEVATDNEIPVIATIATNSKITQADDGTTRPWAFRTCLSDPQNGAILGQYAVKELGHKRISIIHDIGSDYSIGIMQEFTKNVELAGGVIVSNEAHNTGDVDFRAVLTKIKNAGDFDALFIAEGYYKQIGLIANQARELGITQAFISTEGTQSSDILNIAGDAIEGLVFNVPTNTESDNVKPLIAEFTERWGYDPSINVGGDCYLAYDAFNYLKKAIEIAGSLDTKKIRDALESIEEMEGLTNKIIFDTSRHLVYREVPILQIINGKYEVVRMYMMEKEA